MIKRMASITLAAIVAMVVLAVGSPASADEFSFSTDGGFTTSAGTPDNTTFYFDYRDDPIASVMWNDYADDDHGRDLDDFHVCDTGADNLAPYFQAQYDGVTHSERIDGGKGNCEVQGVGNVSPTGSVVYFRVCAMDGTNILSCAPWNSVIE